MRAVIILATSAAIYAFAPPAARGRRPAVAARRAVADEAVDDDRLPRRPSPAALPEEVVAAQMVALAFGDVFRCFKFASLAASRGGVR